MDNSGLKLENFSRDLDSYLNKAFVDESTLVEKNEITPKLIINNGDKKLKVVDTIKNLLLDCDEFYFSVAFINYSGLILLIETFNSIQNKGKNIKGRILTTDYLSFTEPKALLWLKENTNFEIKMYVTNKNEKNGGFHTKGYFFKNGDITKALIGSSNLTDSALTKNQEWNAYLISTLNGEFIKECNDEFERLWNIAYNLDSYIETYKSIYIKSLEYRNNNFENKIDKKFEPNDMQIQFVENLKQSISKGNRRGLLISATGTGKTYAAAFGAKEIFFNKRILFIVHNIDILKQAIKTFKNVFGCYKKFGIISGTPISDIKEVPLIDVERDNFYSFDIIFAMKESLFNRVSKFSADFFDLIIIDEAHKCGSKNYLELVNYFKPEFLLGMTATPERTENYTKIFELFGDNVLLEIRLKDALDYDYLCPFHYFGITDIEGVDDEKFDLKDFNSLYSETRINFILEKSKYYGYSGNKIHGLIFVSTIEDGKFLEKELNKRNLKVKFLCGDTSSSERSEAIKNLQEERTEGDHLDFIITINIFNEGIDIPNVNQVILLRPTESTIIFIQQLGRGLRKYKDKSFVVILDFIGIYKNNFMITKALSGEFKGFSDYSNSLIMLANGYVPGISSIEFDEIAKERIFESLNKHRNIKLKELKRVYVNLKRKLGRIPSYNDYMDFGEAGFDPVEFFSCKNSGSYIEFLQKYCYEDLTELNMHIFNQDEIEILNLLSKKIGYGTRIKEIDFLLNIIEKGMTEDESFEFIKEKYYFHDLNRFEIFKERFFKFF